MCQNNRSNGGEATGGEEIKFGDEKWELIDAINEEDLEEDNDELEDFTQEQIDESAGRYADKVISTLGKVSKAARRLTSNGVVPPGMHGAFEGLLKCFPGDHSGRSEQILKD